jgi:predicted DsbA family dithiol-disulfide isomerase
MAKKIKIDFVSDVACPWCVIGLHGLEQALDNARDAVDADITFHPFELNPNMPVGGQNMIEHVGQKYGRSPDQARASRETIKARAAGVGFTMNTSDVSRIYNTFDAHRLLAWARDEGKQLELKHQLFVTNFTDQRDPGDHGNLVEAARKAGLDGEAAREVLESGRYGDKVRSEESFWTGRGISGVPAVVVNDRYLISGGQPPEEFERQIRAIAEKL